MIWKYISIVLLGLVLGLCIAFRLKKPEQVINQHIKKLKQRGEGNTQQVELSARQTRREKRKARKAEKARKRQKAVL